MSVTRIMRGALAAAVDLVWPPCCIGCGCVVESGDYLCTGCTEELVRPKHPFCAKCTRPFGDDGTPVRPGGVGMCSECRAADHAFGCAVSFCRHDGLARDLVVRFKYHGEHFLRRPLAHLLAESLQTDERLLDPPADALVPVPLHRRRERERGFNQADALCRRLGRETGLPVWRALRRVRFTSVQARLSRPERLHNLRDAFQPAPRQPVTGAHLLLVDDVFTTGSTVHECARVLRTAGAASVRVLTVTRR